jgi:hypothetical protein
MRSIGSGARNSRTRSGGTTQRPSGLFTSLAIFATNLQGATPADARSPVFTKIAALILAAIVGPSPKSDWLAVTSRKASSSDNPSTSGVNVFSTSNTSALTSA